MASGEMELKLFNVIDWLYRRTVRSKPAFLPYYGGDKVVNITNDNIFNRNTVTRVYILLDKFNMTLILSNHKAYNIVLKCFLSDCLLKPYSILHKCEEKHCWQSLITRDIEWREEWLYCFRQYFCNLVIRNSNEKEDNIYIAIKEP